MVLDDDQDFVDLLEIVLEQEGFRVVPCPAPNEAHRMARQLWPDTLIVDLLMPGLNGWQVIEQLRSDPRLGGVHIIVCTASVFGAQSLARTRQLGCDVLLKPFELDDLVAAVRRAKARCKAS
jgi:DNA-binding response OmpR family regulator